MICNLASLGKHKPNVAMVIVDASKNTSGIDCWPMILTMIAKGFSWTGFCSRPAASVAAHPCFQKVVIMGRPVLPLQTWMLVIIAIIVRFLSTAV